MAPNLTLGLMTHRIITPARFRRHARAAFLEGFQTVVLFEPDGVQLKGRRLVGYVCARTGPWRRQSFRLPDIAMDIGYYTTPSDIRSALRAKTAPSLLNFTGYGLGNKWTIQQHLLRSQRLLPYLLPTLPAKGAQEVMDFADAQRIVMLKPINGKGGQGIVRLSAPTHRQASRAGSPAAARRIGSYGARDNERVRAFATRAAAHAFARRVLARGPHLMQRWIDIRSKRGCVYDIRALVQKDGSGLWRLSGLAVREGRLDKITSNLKTGGRAYDASLYLKQQFGEELGCELTLTAQNLAAFIPVFLERSYDIRLSELGIDLAVDRDGSIWLLEVNIKPGRRVIQQVYGKKSYEESFRLPFRYARHLLRPEAKEPAGSELLLDADWSDLRAEQPSGPRPESPGGPF